MILAEMWEEFAARFINLSHFASSSCSPGIIKLTWLWAVLGYYTMSCQFTKPHYQ